MLKDFVGHILITEHWNWKLKKYPQAFNSFGVTGLKRFHEKWINCLHYLQQLVFDVVNLYV